MVEDAKNEEVVTVEIHFNDSDSVISGTDV